MSSQPHRVTSARQNRAFNFFFSFYTTIEHKSPNQNCIQVTHHWQSLYCEGHHFFFFTTIFFQFSLFSTAHWDLANSRPVHSLMLPFHLFLCLPCLLHPFTVPCRMVLAMPDERETWPYHCSLQEQQAVYPGVSRSESGVGNHGDETVHIKAGLVQQSLVCCHLWGTASCVTWSIQVREWCL